ncbi:MAG: heavy-metal-associated domain-containing protein [Gemmatimonadota bacterium]
MKKLDDCHVEPLDKPVAEAAIAHARTATLSVNGMGCVNCAHRVRNGLLRREGVYRVDVDLGAGTARVQFDASVIDLPDLLEAVAAAGAESHHAYSARILDVLETQPLL